MKAVALLVLYVGYAALVYGVNHVTGGCVSFKDVAFPQGGSISDPCNGAGTTGSSTGTGDAGPATTGAVTGASLGTQSGPGGPGSGYNPSPSGNAYTLPKNPGGKGGYVIKGQKSTTGNPHHLTYTNVQ